MFIILALVQNNTITFLQRLKISFITSGRQFNKDGELKEWWDENTIKKFKEKAQCFIDQYGGYSLPEVNLNVSNLRTGYNTCFRASRKSWGRELVKARLIIYIFENI